MYQEELSTKKWIEMWNVIKEKLFDVDLWLMVGWTIIQIIVIWIAAGLLVKVSWKLIDNVLNGRAKNHFKVDERRTKTLGILIHNVARYAIYFFALLMILGKLNFNLGPLLAGAGVLGLAIGFGAQSLVKDVITGFFIVFEDQYAVGDTISIGNYTGTVEEIGLRVTKIRNWTGEIHIIPNGNISEVTNFSTHNSVAVVDIGVAYEEDIEKVTRVIQEIIDKVYKETPEMVKPPEVLGVQNLGASDIVLRITAETKPMNHFSIARKIRAKIKEGFDQEGIEIPYPRLVTFQRKEE